MTTASTSWLGSKLQVFHKGRAFHSHFHVSGIGKFNEECFGKLAAHLPRRLQQLHFDFSGNESFGDEGLGELMAVLCIVVDCVSRLNAISCAAGARFALSLLSHCTAGARVALCSLFLTSCCFCMVIFTVGAWIALSCFSITHVSSLLLDKRMLSCLLCASACFA